MASEMMAGLDAFQVIKVGQSSGDLQNAIVGAGTEAHLRHGMFEMLPRVVVDFAMLANEPRRHLGVRIDLLVLEALLLDSSSGRHTLADFQRTFTGRFGSQVGIFHGRHFDVDIDTIEQRARGRQSGF